MPVRSTAVPGLFARACAARSHIPCLEAFLPPSGATSHMVMATPLPPPRALRLPSSACRRRRRPPRLTTIARRRHPTGNIPHALASGFVSFGPRSPPLGWSLAWPLGCCRHCTSEGGNRPHPGRAPGPCVRPRPARMPALALDRHDSSIGPRQARMPAFALGKEPHMASRCVFILPRSTPWKRPPSYS